MFGKEEMVTKQIEKRRTDVYRRCRLATGEFTLAHHPIIPLPFFLSTSLYLAVMAILQVAAKLPEAKSASRADASSSLLKESHRSVFA